MTEQARSWPASKIVETELSKLRSFENNARTHSKEQVDQIAKAILEWGWTNPILVTVDGMIIAGHGRVLAARQIGFDKVPAVIVDDWSEDQIRAYVIADNKLAMNAGWDEELLAYELSQLEEVGFAVDLIGFSQAELQELVPSEDQYLTDPDEVPDPPKKATTKAGNVWQLGEHLLACGDATDPGVYQALLGGEFADLCWTDPPYNVNYQSKAGRIENDNLEDSAFLEFLKASFGRIHDRLKPGGAVYIAHADMEGLNFRTAFFEAGFKLSGVLIWEKNSLVLGRSDYQWKHEPILYGWKPGAAHKWLGDRKQTTIAELSGNVFAQNDDGSINVRVGNETIVIEGDNITARAIEPSVIRVDKPKLSADHPTMKPIELISSMLTNSSKKGDVVLDPFGGSGSTLIAAEMLGRRARLVELDPVYCDVIVRRWEDMTGAKAILRGD